MVSLPLLRSCGAAARMAVSLALISAMPCWGQPDRVLSWPLAAQTPSVTRLGAPPLRVMDIAVDGDTVWVATRGAGLYAIGTTEITHLDIGRPLPSAVVWQVQPWRGALLAGTASGLMLIDRANTTAQRLKPEPARAGSAEFVRARPGGDPFVQFRGGQPTAMADARWRVKGASLVGDATWPAGAVATAGTFDAQADCLDLAGVVTRRGATAIWYASECADPARSQRLTVLSAADDALGVAAIARDPLTRRPVLAVVQQRGPDPSSRRHVLFEWTGAASLRRHCSGADFDLEVTALAQHPQRHGLVAALYGGGLVALDCGGPPRPIVADAGGDAPALRMATALALDRQNPGRLLVGTDSGLYALSWAPGHAAPRVEALLNADRLRIAGATLPADALPFDVADDGRVLLVSAQAGVYELSGPGDGAIVLRSWQPQATAPGQALPTGVYGAAAYTSAPDIAVVVQSTGVFRSRSGVGDWLPMVAMATPAQLLGLAAQADGALWVSLGATPALAAAAVHRYPADASPPWVMSIQGAAFEPSSRLLLDRQGRVWVGSRAGVLQLGADGRITPLSSNAVHSLFGNREHPEWVAAVGSSIERWTGERFEPVPFALPAQAAAPYAPLAHPVDVVIDNRGRWSILYANGAIVLLDAQARFERILGYNEGVPASACKLLHITASDEVLIGSRSEGLFVLRR